MNQHNDVTLLREAPGDVPGVEQGGFMVIEITRERGTFSVTSMTYTSRRAYELGNTAAVFEAGSQHEKILAVAPELEPIIKVHLADVDNGEPMHAASNGWYRLGGGDMAHDLDYHEQWGRGNYWNAPAPYVGLTDAEQEDYEARLAEGCNFWACEGPDAPWVNMKTCTNCAVIKEMREKADTMRPEYAQFFVDMAARVLRCDPSELPNTNDEDVFLDWLDETMRPRWQRDADLANEWIDAHKNEVEQPSEVMEEPEFEVELEGGLRVTAKVRDEPGYRGHDDVHWAGAPFHEYDVTITNGSYTYEGVYGGSIADYQDGKVNAREAGMNTLHELAGFVYESAEEMAEGMGMEMLPDDQSNEERETLKKMKEAEHAADELARELALNLEAIGA